MSHLDHLPTLPGSSHRQFIALSRSGRVVTTDGLESTITIVDPKLQHPPQLIETGVVIKGLLLTGAVILVVGLNEVMAWRLTKEGSLDGVFDDRMSDRSDCVWVMSLSLPEGARLEFKVEGQIGVIERDGNALLLYNTATGEVLESTSTPPLLGGTRLDITKGLRGRDYRHCHNLSPSDTPPRGSWHPPETASRQGWVKDPEGRHRLWLHVEWRKSWDLADWCHDITTQFSIIEGQPLVIRF